VDAEQVVRLLCDLPGPSQLIGGNPEVFLQLNSDLRAISCFPLSSQREGVAWFLDRCRAHENSGYTVLTLDAGKLDYLAILKGKKAIVHDFALFSGWIRVNPNTRELEIAPTFSPSFNSPRIIGLTDWNSGPAIERAATAAAQGYFDLQSGQVPDWPELELLRQMPAPCDIWDSMTGRKQEMLRQVAATTITISQFAQAPVKEQRRALTAFLSECKSFLESDMGDPMRLDAAHDCSKVDLLCAAAGRQPLVGRQIGSLAEGSNGKGRPLRGDADGLSLARLLISRGYFDLHPQPVGRIKRLVSSALGVRTSPVR
jgi:hypothetical protein